MSDACPFCERIAQSDYIWMSDEGVVTFEPLNPVVQGHMLIVPVRHVEDAATDPKLTGSVFKVAATLAKFGHPAFNLISSAGEAATQTVRHLHVHYVPRRSDDGLLLPWSGQRLRSRLDWPWDRG